MVAIGALMEDEEERDEVEKQERETDRRRAEDERLRDFLIKQRQDDISERNAKGRPNGTPKRIVLRHSDKPRPEIELPPLQREPGSEIRSRSRKPRK
jgi:hypothetical protein